MGDYCPPATPRAVEMPKWRESLCLLLVEYVGEVTYGQGVGERVLGDGLSVDATQGRRFHGQGSVRPVDSGVNGLSHVSPRITGKHKFYISRNCIDVRVPMATLRNVSLQIFPSGTHVPSAGLLSALHCGRCALGACSVFHQYE